CDGWEVRDEPLAVYGRWAPGVKHALQLTSWSGDVTLCTDGPRGLSPAQRSRLTRHGVGLREQKLARVEGAGGRLGRLLFEEGGPLPCRALFLTPQPTQHSDLALRLGCRLGEGGLVETTPDGKTEVPGVFVAGDASGGTHLAIVAAAE